MAHVHDHHGDDAREYFTEQLLTIFVCGMFGFAAVRLYQTGMLAHALAPQFEVPVLVGGLALLALVAVRAVCVWREAGQTQAHGHHHDHDGHDHHHDHAHDPHHEHGPDCDHTHDHNHSHGHVHHAHGHAHDHTADDHGHSHDLAWVFARMLVLFFPVALYLIGVPNKGFSQEYLDRLVGTGEVVSGDFGNAARGEGNVMSFNDIREAAFDEGKRASLEGKVGILEGLFQPIGQNQFTLYKLKRACCASDAVPLKLQVVTPTALSGFDKGQWVRVKGEVRFVGPPGSAQKLPIIVVADITDVQKAPAQDIYE
ncbi:MAG: hypothetical protein K2X82_11355 [Gemmataceae bacterium]|nr:hypothetical protein [Gemmataceae bacterium]